MKKPKSDVLLDDRDFPMSLGRKCLFQATGIDIAEGRQKPIIAIANSQTEINPGHMHLDGIAQRVKEGVHAAGGIPFEFSVPAPCDGLTEGHEGMRFVLAQRDLIADIIETHVRSMMYDAIVLVASCDKIVPGMLMAAARLKLPAIFMTGGPNAWDIRFKSTFKGSVDRASYDDPRDKLATATGATCGACELMGTANTMQCLTEALGLALPRSANVPAYHAEKLLFARMTGKRIVEMVEEELTADKILTPNAIENAIMVDLAIGGSTNATLHLPALAHEIGFDLPLTVFNDFSKRIPTLCAISPNGPHGVIDLYVAGGVPAVMSRLADDLHLDALTVAGNTIGDVVRRGAILDEDVIRDKASAYLPEGSTVVLAGNLAPEGAVVKQSAVAPDMLVYSGKARVFESEHDCLKAIRERSIQEGEVVVIRNEGPKGAPGMPETLAVTLGLEFAGFKRVALITDGRFSGATAGPCIGHVSPEARVGGPIAVVRDGDEISIDIPTRKLELRVSDEEIKSRLARWKPTEREVPPGFMRRYVKLVSSAARGAVLE
ncbi:MAG: dihydroxy-acid dehydratase [Methanomassiliicoccales archaeon]|nr:dihydroxy-acid dehydratase [Methanomassiliicoccales archaeon]